VVEEPKDVQAIELPRRPAVGFAPFSARRALHRTDDSVIVRRLPDPGIDLRTCVHNMS
jgi:hypothetical protein